MSCANAQKSAEEIENKGFNLRTLRKLDSRVEENAGVSWSDISSDCVGNGDADCGAALRERERGKFDCEVQNMAEILDLSAGSK